MAGLGIWTMFQIPIDADPDITNIKGITEIPEK
jgi:Cu/Ag efflux pump CusA